MNIYRFEEAGALGSFLEDHRDQIVGAPLEKLSAVYWMRSHKVDSEQRIPYVFTDVSLVLQVGQRYVLVDYWYRSSLELTVCDETELRQVDAGSYAPERLQSFAGWLLYRDDEEEDDDEDADDADERKAEELRAQVEGCRIVGIDVERFSESFEASPSGTVRPAGGDYFGSIRVRLDSGIIVCICAEDAANDGYCDVWYET